MQSDVLFLPDYEAHIRYYRSPGQTPARVYLHGLGGESLTTFLHIVSHPELVDHYTLLVDFLGFGLSEPAQNFDYSLESHAHSVALLIDHLGLTACELVGASLGGSVAILLAALRPDLVSRLVVAEGNLDPGIGTMSASIAAQSEEEYLTAGHAAALHYVRANLPLIAGCFAIADPFATYWTSRKLFEGTRPTMREHFLSLSIPRVFIAGEKSLPNPQWETLPNAGIPVLVVPNAGHVMMIDNPNGFAETIATALAPSR
jgi:pimeloyl-ACP methyl ester carboxylesterase